MNSSVDVSERTYRYTGKERDEETGLGYHGARYYACWLGRWTASDPIGLGDGVNRYAYVSGNPISSVDPSGTAEEDQTPRFGAPGLVTTGHGGLKPQTLGTDAEEEVNFTFDDQKPANDLLAVPNGGPKDFVAKGRRNKQRADAAIAAIGANRDALATTSSKGVVVLFIAGASGGVAGAALSAAGGGLVVVGAGSGAVEEGVRRGGLAFVDGASGGEVASEAAEGAVVGGVAGAVGGALVYGAQFLGRVRFNRMVRSTNEPMTASGVIDVPAAAVDDFAGEAGAAVAKNQAKVQVGPQVEASAAGGGIRGVGPQPGVIEASSRVKSSAQLRNFDPRPNPSYGGERTVEFVYDPVTKRFAVGKAQGAGSPHQKLASAINPDYDHRHVVGGTFSRGSQGEIVTSEYSGHFGENWTDAMRVEFVEFLEEATSQRVVHQVWPGG